MNFFTSDTHFGHKNIISFCNNRQKMPGVCEIEMGHIFDYNVSAMNEALVDNWNSVVSNEDTVYFLGDLAMGDIRENIKISKRLNGYKKLYAGNHDRCWYGNKNFRDWIPVYEECGWEVDFMGPHDYVDINIMSIPCIMSHFPYHDDNKYDARYMSYRPMDKGKYLLHGHVHDAWKFNDRMINVGTDVWDFKPVPEYILAKYIINGKI